MEERRRFEDFVTSFSARFIDLPADEVEAAIDGALLEMLDALGSDRAGFVAYDEDGGPPRSAHVVARPGVETYDVSQLLQWAWFLGELTAGREIRLSRMPEDLPPEVTELERRHVAETGMRSLLSVPLHVGGRLSAILTTGCFRAYRDWTPTDAARLRLVGTIFANAVYRRQSEFALRSRIAEIARSKTGSRRRTSFSGTRSGPSRASTRSSPEAPSWPGSSRRSLRSLRPTRRFSSSARPGRERSSSRTPFTRGAPGGSALSSR